MRVRHPEPAESGRIADLAGQLGYPVDEGLIRKRLERLLADPAHCVLVAAESDGTLLGWIHAGESCPLEYGPRCEIFGLVVSDTARGHGIGRTLVDAVSHWAMGRSLPEVAVRSNAARTESHPFYLQLGFTRIKTQHVYRLPLPALPSH